MIRLMNSNRKLKYNRIWITILTRPVAIILFNVKKHGIRLDKIVCKPEGPGWGGAGAYICKLYIDMSRVERYGFGGLGFLLYWAILFTPFWYCDPV